MTPTNFLTAAIALIESGRFRLGAKAQVEAEAMGFDAVDVEMAVLDLTAGDFWKVQRETGRRPAFIFDPELDGPGVVYIKLTIDRLGCLVISFHPKQH